MAKRELMFSADFFYNGSALQVYLRVTRTFQQTNREVGTISSDQTPELQVHLSLIRSGQPLTVPPTAIFEDLRRGERTKACKSNNNDYIMNKNTKNCTFLQEF